MDTATAEGHLIGRKRRRDRWRRRLRSRDGYVGLRADEDRAPATTLGRESSVGRGGPLRTLTASSPIYREVRRRVGELGSGQYPFLATYSLRDLP